MTINSIPTFTVGGSGWTAVVFPQQYYYYGQASGEGIQRAVVLADGRVLAGGTATIVAGWNADHTRDFALVPGFELQWRRHRRHCERKQ